MFISLEGIDGAGKTSAAKVLTEKVRESGRVVEYFEHNLVRAALPYVDAQLGNIQGIQRQALASPFHQICELHWVLLRASYYALVAEQVVAPATRAGSVVITDGWFYKFAARIASNGSMRLPQIMKYVQEVRSPDLVILLDVDPSVAAARKDRFNAGELGPQNMYTNNPTEAFVRYQSLVRANLLHLARLGAWPVLNASCAIGETVSGIMDCVARYSSPLAQRPA